MDARCIYTENTGGPVILDPHDTDVTMPNQVII